MADALCGPSNPLQNFQKHSSVDRSLQQDRLASRSSAAQGFRSQQGPPPGLLDPEFEAFKAGGAAQFQEPQIPHHGQHYLPPSHAQSTGSEPGPDSSAWASDFQRLQISQPPPGFHTQQQRQPPSSWHADFQRHQSPGINPSPQNAYQSMPNYSYQQPMFQTQSYGQPMFNQNQDMAMDKGKTRLRDNDIDEAAMEKEFEAHAQNLLDASNTQEFKTEEVKNREINAHGMDSTQEKLNAVNEGASSIYQNYKDMQQESDWNATAQEALIDRDSIRQAEVDAVDHAQQEEQPREAPMTQGDDDLAATAGELLDRVSDNRSQKFIDSTFLAFMERIRDREVRVEGDKFVDVDSTMHEDYKASNGRLQGDTSGRIEAPSNTYMAGALDPGEIKSNWDHPKRSSESPSFHSDQFPSS